MTTAELARANAYELQVENAILERLFICGRSDQPFDATEDYFEYVRCEIAFADYRYKLTVRANLQRIVGKIDGEMIFIGAHSPRAVTHLSTSARGYRKGAEMLKERLAPAN